MAQMKIQLGILAAVLALLVAPFAYGADKPVTGKQQQRHVAGEKLDSGLGNLPHYREWAKQPANSKLFALASHVPGEKLDSGLGKLPHYSQWAKHPETQALVALASHVPGEKLDSGLGELPPYREWADNTSNQHLAAAGFSSSK